MSPVKLFCAAVLCFFAQVQAQLRNCDNDKGQRILIDLGANCGNSYELLNERFGGPFDRTYLWEVNPLLFDQLEELANTHSEIELVKFGAWSENSDMQLDVLGKTREECDRNFWGGTSIVETEHNMKSGRYKESVTAHTLDFVKWYKDNVCEQDEVTLKIDIERAEYVVLSKMVVSGILCHPKRILIEWHQPHEPLTAPQHFRTRYGRERCFSYVHTLEYMLQFCEREPEFFGWA